MLSERIETKAIVVNYPQIAACVTALGGTELHVPALLQHFYCERGVRRVVHQIHVITDSNGLPQRVRDDFVNAGANVHVANGDRTECLTFLHTERMAELFDVVALLVTDSGYLPLIRHAKTLGCRLELHAIWSSDPALLWAADEVVGLYPPGAPIQKLEAAA